TANTKLAAVESRSARANDVFGWLSEYQRKAEQTDQNPRGGMEGLAFPLLGLFGEVGTLLSALKKKQRDKDSYVGYWEAVLEEFGDVFWYFSNVASRASLDLRDIAERGADDSLNASRYKSDQTRSDNSPEFESAVIALAGKAGLLLNEFSAGRVKNNRDLLSVHLAEIFCALVRAA